MSTPSAQMACCKNGHACAHHETPAECCKTTLQADQFTTVGKITAPVPQLVSAQTFGSAPITLEAPWHPNPLSNTWSPPGAKHPTYLRLSILRL